MKKEHYENAVQIFNELKKKGESSSFPKITTWELYDKAFTFQKVRLYSQVSESMNQLEQFEDNANMNLNNSLSIAKFIANAQAVRNSLLTKYGEAFRDPSTFDPQAENKKTWWGPIKSLSDFSIRYK